jgi:hypothetical protein
MANVLKKLGKKIGRLLPGTGRHAAKRAEKAAKEYAATAQAQTRQIEERTEKERKRAQKLAIRGIRSKRAASHFGSPTQEYTSYGSPTIG